MRIYPVYKEYQDTSFSNAVLEEVRNAAIQKQSGKGETFVDDSRFVEYEMLFNPVSLKNFIYESSDKR